MAAWSEAASSGRVIDGSIGHGPRTRGPRRTPERFSPAAVTFAKRAGESSRSSISSRPVPYVPVRPPPSKVGCSATSFRSVACSSGASGALPGVSLRTPTTAMASSPAARRAS